MDFLLFFFFKQKTAYEMRISDWSSDVCSSDLPYNDGLGPVFEIIGGKWKALILWELHDTPVRFGALKRRIAGISEKMLIQQLREMEADGDRKSAGEGKSMTVREDLGGRRIIKKKNM